MVSIIMPAYNAEKYISETIKSILNQTCKDWELIIVDDGSTDATGLISDKYAASDARIKVLHQTNAGVCKARNTGISKASGELIAFADADDILTPESLAVRVRLMDGADMAVAGYELFDETGVLEKMPGAVRDRWDQHDAVLNIIAAGELGYQGYIWNKMFRKELFEQYSIHFDEKISLNEDRLFCVEYALCCKNVHLSDDLVYRYRITEGNTTSSACRVTEDSIKKISSEFKAFDKAIKLVDNKYKDCYYWAAVEAQYRAVVLKRKMRGESKSLDSYLNKKIQGYGQIAMKAPATVISLKKKAVIAGHMLAKA